MYRFIGGKAHVVFKRNIKTEMSVYKTCVFIETGVGHRYCKSKVTVHDVTFLDYDSDI